MAEKLLFSLSALNLALKLLSPLLP